MVTVAPQVERVQRKVVRVLTGTQILGSAAVTIGLAFSTLIAASLSGSEAVGGLAQTAAVAGAALLALPGARLAQRSGRRPALVLGYGMGGLGALIAAVAVGLGLWQMLLVGLLLFGGASSANYAARYAATDLAHPHRRARELSRVVWAAMIGAIIGPNLADPAGRAAGALGLPAGVGPFLLAAVVLAAAVLVIQFGLRPDPLVVVKSTRPVESADCCAGGSSGESPRGLKIWATLGPMARLALVGVMLCHTAMVGLMSMTPVHMNHAGSSLRVVGVVISLHVAAMYAASPLFGWMADRMGRVPVLAIGASLVVAASGVAGMAPSHDAPQLAAGLALLGFGWSAGLVAGSALLTESVRVDDRPAAQGLSDLMMNVGGAIGGAVAGVVVTAWSYAALGLIVGFTALPLLVVCLFASLRRPVR
ncbi:MFS transporter [Lentzea flaviverrucosa]|uniref:Predicted arabinose efflux permease, MFS family n=1 Tax=Lentzea flaviverrucosa TaxID=200379 RepID=A0A1H9XWU8_9PSEU|nr:MFS transporter [Lentzea flaviverrucosa]RDI17511.1 putative MFS family arabinose efflux permease [Lentzea flaviverrucosa]SES50621.1 Predicted arabinose efflux permease, MFS family [Lentzea flaviverrucosa]